MSSVVVGAAVFTPILAVVPLPVCVIAELWTLVADVNRGRAFTDPPVVVTSDNDGGFTDEEGAAPGLPVDPAVVAADEASTKADGGRPPIDSASAAFSA